MTDTFLTGTDGAGVRENLAANVAILGRPHQVLDDNHAVASLLYVVPDGYRVHEIDLSPYRDQPARKTGVVTAHDSGSFVAYINRHGEPERTSLFADKRSATVTAFLNGHSDTGAGWGDHKVVLRCKTTPAWDRWMKHHGEGRLLAQADFAEFVEDSLADFVKPAGAQMLEIAETFKANTGIEFESASKVSNGERQLVYKQTVTAKAGQTGHLDIPETVEVGLVPWDGCAPYRVTGRLRYRVRDGVLSLGIRLDRVEEVIEAAFADLIDGITDRVTVDGVLTIHGQA